MDNLKKTFIKQLARYGQKATILEERTIEAYGFTSHAYTLGMLRQDAEPFERFYQEQIFDELHYTHLLHPAKSGGKAPFMTKDFMAHPEPTEGVFSVLPTRLTERFYDELFDMLFFVHKKAENDEENPFWASAKLELSDYLREVKWAGEKGYVPMHTQYVKAKEKAKDRLKSMKGIHPALDKRIDKIEFDAVEAFLYG